LAKVITIAARDGGGDPSANPSLRMAIDNARSSSMPKENIERAIQKGVGGGTGANIESITYEAYGPGGVALLIECLTDNKNRALSEVKMMINKHGGNFASAGSVSYLFQKKGEIMINRMNKTNKTNKTEEEIEETIIESGADDYEIEDDTYIIVYTSPNDLHQVKTRLEEAGIIIDSAELTNIASTFIGPPDDKKAKVETLIESLDDLEDVNKVYTNANL
jgi:YebC/PmpR family DNA-binding regulatory protein